MSPIIPPRQNTTSPPPSTSSDASSSPYPPQDLIFGIFGIVLACATLAVAILQIVQLQMHRQRATNRTTAVSLGMISIVTVLEGDTNPIPSTAESTIALVPVPITSPSQFDFQPAVPQILAAKPSRIDSGIVMEDDSQ